MLRRFFRCIFICGKYGPHEIVPECVLKYERNFVAGTVLILVVKSRRIHKMRVFQSELSHLFIHHICESRFTSRRIKGKGDRAVRARRKYEPVHQIAQRHLLAVQKSRNGGVLEEQRIGYRGRHFEGIVEVFSVLGGDDQSHHFGHRGGIHFLVTLFRCENRIVFKINENCIIRGNIVLADCPAVGCVRSVHVRFGILDIAADAARCAPVKGLPGNAVSAAADRGTLCHGKRRRKNYYENDNRNDKPSECAAFVFFFVFCVFSALR